MPNPLRKIAKNRPLYTVLIKLWCDDVSGNKSKQWNKHINWCWIHVGIPQLLQNQEYFVRFISTSTKANAIEQGSAISSQIIQSQKGIIAYDSKHNEEIVFRTGVFDIVGDNPMQSEIASHSGLTSVVLCRKGDGGGSKAHRKTAEGFESLFHVSNEVINSLKILD